jgi:hypothetical protein
MGGMSKAPSMTTTFNRLEEESKEMMPTRIS